MSSENAHRFLIIWISLLEKIRTLLSFPLDQKWRSIKWFRGNSSMPSNFIHKMRAECNFPFVLGIWKLLANLYCKIMKFSIISMNIYAFEFLHGNSEHMSPPAAHEKISFLFSNILYLNLRKCCNDVPML